MMNLHPAIAMIITFVGANTLAEIAPRWDRSAKGYLKDIDSAEKAQSLISWRSDEETDIALNLIWKGPQGETKKLAVKNCEDYLAARDLHYRPESSADGKREHWFRFRCESLRRVTEAKPSRVSYLKDYRFHSGSLKELPPCLGGMGGVDGYRTAVERAMESLTSWKSFAPDKTVVRADAHQIVFQNKDETITAEATVWGDFNGDGIEDMLLLVATQPSRGNDDRYRDYAAVALTRLANEPFFRALGEVGEWACRPQLTQKVNECRWDNLDDKRGTFTSFVKRREYEKALAYWTGLFEKCETVLSEERRLNFLADLSAAAERAKKWDICRTLAKKGLTTEAKDWVNTRTVLRSLKQNHDLCVGKITTDPRRREPTAELSDDGVPQVDEVVHPWEIVPPEDDKRPPNFPRRRDF